MAAVGLDNAVFWTFLIFMRRYIPVIGGAIAGLAAAAVRPGAVRDLLAGHHPVRGRCRLILFVVGNVIQPRMQGDNQNIDPIVVLLALAFWGAIWGVTGMFLSTPLTVMAMVILAEFQGSRWIAVLLSGDGDPYPDNDPHDAHKDPPKPTRRRQTKPPRPKARKAARPKPA